MPPGPHLHRESAAHLGPPVDPLFVPVPPGPRPEVFAQGKAARISANLPPGYSHLLGWALRAGRSRNRTQVLHRAVDLYAAGLRQLGGAAHVLGPAAFELFALAVESCGAHPLPDTARAVGVYRQLKEAKAAGWRIELTRVRDGRRQTRELILP